jgi:glycerol-3-phosphate dehydrogenase
VGSEDGGDTTKLARDDVIEVDPASGLISIMGGKWTTHRAMAEDTIDRVEQTLGLPHAISQTRNYVLYGGTGFTDDYWDKLPCQQRLPGKTARHLASKFGTAAEKVLALASKNAALLDPILEAHPAIKAEVVYAARHEMAATIEDVLARRIGMQLYSWRDAIQAAPVVGSLIAEELSWTSSFTRTAIMHFVEKVNHLLDSAGLSRERSPASMSRESAAAQQ